MGHSDGMREGAHQIGLLFCKNMVKSASFSLLFDFVLTGMHLKNVTCVLLRVD